jgi:putative nucleotidyltransferase with HDIG domain
MASIHISTGFLVAPPPSADEQRIAAEQLLRRLPALPTVSARLLGMMGRTDVNLKEVSNLIVSDAALTGELLHMSNSAMFGARTEVRSILQALAVLGLEKVKGLACTVALRSYLGNALQIPALKKCWRHNLATAVVSSEIADWARQDSGEAYTAGILHDIGRLALIAVDPAKYLKIIDNTAYHGGTLCHHEREAYGLDHAVAGEWLASSWGLPRVICSAIRDHHQPLDTPFDEVTGLLYYGCRISETLGFSPLEVPESAESAVQEFLSHLPAAQQARLNINVTELQILIASRVNALEV